MRMRGVTSPYRAEIYEHPARRLSFFYVVGEQCRPELTLRVLACPPFNIQVGFQLVV